MTIERTRELLGDKVSDLSDLELLNFIQRTDNALTHIMNLAIQKPPIHKKAYTI